MRSRVWRARCRQRVPARAAARAHGAGPGGRVGIPTRRAHTAARAVLRHLPQRQAEDRRAGDRSAGPCPRGPARRDVGESRPQAAHARDAARRAPRPDNGAPTSAPPRRSRRRSTPRPPRDPQPGRVAVHRLNRTEYTNAIRDLLASTWTRRRCCRPTSPISRASTTWPACCRCRRALLENYLSAACRGQPAGGRRRDRAAAVEDTSRVPTGAGAGRARRATICRSARGAARRSATSSRSTASTRIKVLLRRQLYLLLIGMGEPQQIDIRLDGALVRRFSVGGEGKGATAPESFAGNTQGDPEWEVYMHTADDGLSVRVPVKAGTHRRRRVVRAACMGTGGDPAAAAARVRAHDERAVLTATRRWRAWPIAGPYRAAWPAPTRPAAARLFICQPASPAAEEACARRILSRLARGRIGARSSAAISSTLMALLPRGPRRRTASTAASSAGCDRAACRSPSLPVPRRCRARAARAGRGVSAQRPRARVASLVLPVEQRARRRAAERRPRAARCRTGRRCERQVRRMLADPRVAALVETSPASG